MSPIDDELRRALELHADDVPPPRDFVARAESRARTIQRRRAAAAVATTTVAVVALAVVVPLMRAGDGQPAEVFTPSPAPVTSTPASSTQAATSAAATPASPTPVGPAVAVYYVHDNGTRLVLVREFRKVSADTNRMGEALDLMVQPPLDPDYRTLWPKDPTQTQLINEWHTRAGLVTLVLNPAALQGSGGSEAACLSLQQLIWTVTANDTTIKRVALTVDGKADGVVSNWWGVGCGPDEPMTRHSPAFEVLAPVQISSHNEGDTIRGNRFTFGGEASVFEATVSWSVVDTSGKTLIEGHDNATVGAPARGSWQANVVLPSVKVGDRLELRAWETSMKDGSVKDLDTKRVTIGR